MLISSHIHGSYYHQYLKRAARLNAQTRGKTKWLENFKSAFCNFPQTFFEWMNHSPQCFLDLSCWEKDIHFWHFKEVSLGGKRLFVSRSWILLGSLGAELPRCCWVNPSGPGWVGSMRASRHSAVTDDSTAQRAASLQSTAQRHLLFTQNHESSCRSPLMWLWQENNFQNVLRPQAPLK